MINIGPYCTTTSTNPANIYTVTMVYQKPLTNEEQRRRDRAKKWYDKAMARSDAWLKQRMIEIEADCKANEWRPRVSSGKLESPHMLAYWTLGRATEDEWYPEDGPTWKTYRNRYNKKWMGLTVTNVSPFELDAIKAFLKTVRKKDILIAIPDKCEDSDGRVGMHKDLCYGYWFRNMDEHNRFVEMLDALPIRDVEFILGEAAEQDSIDRLLENVNYRFIRGSHGTLLSMSGANETQCVLVKMFVG